MSDFPKNMTVKESELSQEFDLLSITGVDLSTEPRLRQEIGQEIIDFIRDRNDKGIDLFGNKFDKYSSEYINSDDFEQYGKSASKINMELTGDMLGSIELDDKTSKIKVYVPGDQSPKGYNHQVGDTVKQRSWFGVTDNDLDKILVKFSDDIKRVKNNETTDKQRIQSLIDLMSVALVESKSAQTMFNELFDVTFTGKDIDITKLF